MEELTLGDKIHLQRLETMKKRIKNKQLGLSQHTLDNLPKRFDNNIHKLYQILIGCLGNIRYNRKNKVYKCSNEKYYFVLSFNSIITAVKVEKTY